VDGAAVFPNREPAGFWAAVFDPKSPPVDDEVVVVARAGSPPADVKEKVGALLAPVFPNRPPEAGAVEVALEAAAPDELGVAKVNDMVDIC
jgi:hypothetical protein